MYFCIHCQKQLTHSRHLSDDEISAYQTSTGLSLLQLEQLHIRFLALDREKRGYLTPTELLRIPQLAHNPMHRQIIDGFFPDANQDRIDFNQFVRRCATIIVPQHRNSRVDGRIYKLRLISRMFDAEHTGCSISRTDFRRVMQIVLHSVPPAEGFAICNPGPHCNQTELQQLENQAFGGGAVVGNQCMPYEQFEQRLETTDVYLKLAIFKWFEHINY